MKTLKKVLSIFIFSCLILTALTTPTWCMEKKQREFTHLINAVTTTEATPIFTTGKFMSPIPLSTLAPENIKKGIAKYFAINNLFLRVQIPDDKSAYYVGKFDTGDEAFYPIGPKDTKKTMLKMMLQMTIRLSTETIEYHFTQSHSKEIFKTWQGRFQKHKNTLVTTPTYHLHQNKALYLAYNNLFLRITKTKVERYGPGIIRSYSWNTLSPIEACATLYMFFKHLNLPGIQDLTKIFPDFAVIVSQTQQTIYQKTDPHEKRKTRIIKQLHTMLEKTHDITKSDNDQKATTRLTNLASQKKWIAVWTYTNNYVYFYHPYKEIPLMQTVPGFLAKIKRDDDTLYLEQITSQEPWHDPSNLTKMTSFWQGRDDDKKLLIATMKTAIANVEDRGIIARAKNLNTLALGNIVEKLTKKAELKD
ncbi:hypothetical protein ACFLY6_02410 [Candidatus Dependentiae bacterium]